MVFQRSADFPAVSACSTFCRSILKQVEIIKGPSATFYGGGAIAGVVNFISKEPEDKPVTAMIFNQTTALGTDLRSV